MVKFASVRVEQESSAAPATVYAVLMDVDRWAEWLPTVSAASWEKHGAPDTGLGGVRRVGKGFNVTRDRVVDGTRPSHHAYVASTPRFMLIKDYRGDVRIEESENGSLIIWTVTCTPRIRALNTMFKSRLQSVIHANSGRIGAGGGAPITAPRVRQRGRKLAMPGIAELALGAAPIAGGALLGAAAGSFKGPDIRALILKDMDLLERIPDDQPELKARFKASIDERIHDLIEATEKSRALREAAVSYGGNWRDIVVFICAILFTIIWWHVNHSRSNWLVMFILMIILSVVAAIYAGRGLARAIGNFLHRKDHDGETPKAQ